MTIIAKKMREIKSLAKTDTTSFPMSDDWKRGAAWVIGQLNEITEDIPSRFCSTVSILEEFREVYIGLGKELTQVNPVRFEQLNQLYKDSDLQTRKRILAVAHMIICTEKKGCEA